MNPFRKKCKHEWKIKEKSNALQTDPMGYPLRLYIAKCEKCGEYDQQWLDVPLEELHEVKSGKSFVLKWKKV
jgi:hypothetical protein